MAIKEIFSGKIAIFVYGVITAFIIAWGIVDSIYSERISRLEYDLQREKEKSVSLKENFERVNNILQEVNIKDLMETNKSQQKIMAETLKENKLLEDKKIKLEDMVKTLETKIERLEKELKEKRSSEIISLKDDEKYVANDKDFTLLVRRIVNLINECKISSAGIEAKISEYRNVVRELKKTLPSDPTIQDVQVLRMGLSTHSVYYQEDAAKASNNIANQLGFILDYLREKYQ